MVADGHFRELKMILGLLPKYKGAPVKKNKQKFKKPLPDSGEEYRDYCASTASNGTRVASARSCTHR